MSSPQTTYLSEVLNIIAAARNEHPNSRHLALTHALLLDRRGHRQQALEACEHFLADFGIDGQILETALALRRVLGPLNKVATTGSSSVSLCMIVKNEAVNLPRCLASVMPVVQEMVIVDTGSTDHTVDIATAFGAQVHHFSWTGSFSDARNFSLSKARGQWILIMDADEVFSALDYEKFRRTVASPEQRDAWSIIIRNYTERVHVQGWTANDGRYPSEERADGWYPAQRVKLFPNDPRVQFCGEVHELVEPSLRETGIAIQTAPFTVHHYGELFGLPEELANKQRRYFDLGKQKLEDRPNDLVALTELAVQAGELGLFDTAIALWDRVLALQPDTVEALFNKSYSLICLCRYQEGLDASRRALELDPDHKEAGFNYGTCELYAGDPARALSRLQPLLIKYPEYPPLLALMLLLQFLCGRREPAVVLYAKLKAMNYAVTDYVKAGADVLIRLGKESLARKLFDECTAIRMEEY